MPDSPTEDLEVSQETERQPDVASESSTEQGSEQKTALEAVQAALKGPEKSPDSETQEPKAESETQAAKAPAGDFSPEEINRFKPTTQDRIRQILGERDAVKSSFKAVEPKIQAHDKIVGFMTQHGMTPSDFDNQMNIMAEVKSGNPARALEMLAPLVKDLMKKAGYELPADLQQRVNSQQMTEAQARELNIARATAENAERQRQRETERRESERVRSETEAVVNTAVDAGDQWAAEKAKTDPDWSLKQSRVIQKVELELRRDPNKFPKSAKAVRELCDAKLAEVTEELKELMPRPRNVDPPAKPGSASSRIAAKPTTVLEAVKFGLQQSA